MSDTDTQRSDLGDKARDVVRDVKDRAAGLTDVEVRLYPGARHEILNETNRDEVTREVTEIDPLWQDSELTAIINPEAVLFAKAYEVTPDGLRTLQPLDMETIYKSVKKTGKVIILQEDTLFGGVGSDISSMIMEECFEYLDGPVKRVGSLESAIPFTKALEDQYLAKGRFQKALEQLMAY